MSSLRAAFAEALVDGWHGNWQMYRVVARTWANAEKEPADEQAKYRDLEKLIGCRRIDASDRVQTWIPRHMTALNENLWAGRPRDTCIASARAAVGLAPGRALRISVRARDKRTDWRTVK